MPVTRKPTVRPLPKPQPQKKPELQKQPETKPTVTPKGPTQLVTPKENKFEIVPQVKLPSDQFIDGLQRRSLSKPVESLNLPKLPTESVKVPNVTVPGADAQPSPTEAYVQDAARKLGLSPEVAAIATTELARRLGGDLVVNLDTKKQLLTADDLKADDADGDGMSSYTFSPEAAAVLKDANLAASLGLNSVQELYAKQASEVLPRLREAALNGTDLDMQKELQLVNDPATRQALTSYYELARTTRSLGEGDAAAFERLPYAQKELADAMAKLPKNGPLNEQLQGLQKEVEAAKTLLLQGTNAAGKVPPAAIALMNNITNPPFGKLPDNPEAVSGAIENIANKARENGATEEQASALQQSLQLAYDLKSQGSSTPEKLKENTEKMMALAKQAGPFGAALKPQFAMVQKQAKVNPTVENVMQNVDPAEAKNQAEQVANIADSLKLLAKGNDIKGLPDAIEAIQNAADAIAKGNTAEGILAGIKSAPSIIAALVDLSEKLPQLAPQASDLIKKMGVLFKGPLDIVSTYSNAKKVISGTDIDGNKVSTADRARAASDLLLSDVPGLIGSAATITGSTALAETMAAAAPPLAIALLEVKLMIYTVEEAGKMKEAIMTYDLRDRFDLGKGDFETKLNQQLQTLRDAPTTRMDQAQQTMQKIANEQFTDPDTRARFMAYASTRMIGGRQTMQAIMKGQRIPAFIDRNEPGVTRKEGADTIAAAEDLKKIAADFYKRETNEVKLMLNNQYSGKQGNSYMTTRDQQREMQYWIPSRAP